MLFFNHTYLFTDSKDDISLYFEMILFRSFFTLDIRYFVGPCFSTSASPQEACGNLQTSAHHAQTESQSASTSASLPGTFVKLNMAFPGGFLVSIL